MFIGLRRWIASVMRVASLMSVSKQTDESTAARRMRKPSVLESSSALESRTLMTRSISPLLIASSMLGCVLESGLCIKWTSRPRDL